MRPLGQVSGAQVLGAVSLGRGRVQAGVPGWSLGTPQVGFEGSCSGG